MSTPIAPSRRVTSTEVFCVVIGLAVVSRFALTGLWARPAVEAWTTVFAAICVQAAPYLVLGVLVSTAIAVFVPPSFFARVLPRRSALAVPIAGLAAAALPGCECGSVPVAASLVRRGVARGPAVTFLLAAPAINPVVLVATAVAFPGRPVIVLARLVASFATALTVGWIWQRVGGDGSRAHRHPMVHGAARWAQARATAAHDLGQALGLLVVGAASAALLNVALPRTWLADLGATAAGGIVATAVLAVLLAVCSEADAFIASSFTSFSPTAQLVFMVVGPVVDVKLIAMQAGTFGPRFAARFAPLTLLVAVAAAVSTGAVLL